MKRKVISVITKPNYIVEDYKNPPKDEIKAYRRKRVGSHLVTVAILKNGKTKVTSLWHPKTERKSKTPQVQQRLKQIHKKRGGNK